MTKKQSGGLFWNTVYMEICIHTRTQTHTTILRPLYRSACDSWQSWRILLQQSFTARMPLQMATSTFRLRRRQHFSSAV